MQLNLSGLDVVYGVNNSTDTVGVAGRRWAVPSSSLVSSRRRFANNVVRGFLAGKIWNPEHDEILPSEMPEYAELKALEDECSKNEKIAFWRVSDIKKYISCILLSQKV